VDSLEKDLFSFLWGCCYKKFSSLKVCAKSINKLITEQLLIINSGNLLYSSFSPRIHFSIREKILPLSTVQSPGPLSVLGFLISKRLPKPSLALSVMPRERQKLVLVYVREEQ